MRPCMTMTPSVARPLARHPERTHKLGRQECANMYSVRGGSFTCRHSHAGSVYLEAVEEVFGF